MEKLKEYLEKRIKELKDNSIEFEKNERLSENFYYAMQELRNVQQKFFPIKDDKNKKCEGCRIHPPENDSVYCTLCRKEPK